jgi:hypothetical protein
MLQSYHHVEHIGNYEDTFINVLSPRPFPEVTAAEIRRLHLELSCTVPRAHDWRDR